MKTVEINICKFSELSEEAKGSVINKWRNNGIDVNYIYDEAYATVNKFNELFGINEGSRSWLDFNTDHIDDSILELKGIRLRTYIINNFWHGLYKGKYFSLWSKKDISFKHYKNGYPVLKSRNSKVIFDNSCTLTGVCYDHSMLQPVYDLIEWNEKSDYNSNLDFESLIEDCFHNLKSDLESEVEYMNSDEAITETIEANDYDFTEDGDIY